MEKVKVLKDVKEDLHVDEIYGSLYHTEKGKGILDKEGTKVIKGKTKFANAVVKVDSELQVKVKNSLICKSMKKVNSALM